MHDWLAVRITGGIGSKGKRWRRWRLHTAVCAGQVASSDARTTHCRCLQVRSEFRCFSGSMLRSNNSLFRSDLVHRSSCQN